MFDRTERENVPEENGKLAEKLEALAKEGRAKIEQTEGMLAQAMKLSIVIGSLPLSAKDSKRLVNSILEHTTISVQEAYNQGFAAAIKAIAEL